MEAGPRNWALDRGHTKTGPITAQAGSGVTVKSTSLVSVQPLVWTTVRRNVAFAEATCAVVVNEPGSSMVAVPESTLQFVETIGSSPGVARPCSAKAVVPKHWV